MTAASVEATLELLASSLREVKARMRPLFRQERVAVSAGQIFLDCLLGEERGKTGWMRADAAGDLAPWRQQAILGRRRWMVSGWYIHGKAGGRRGASLGHRGQLRDRQERTRPRPQRNLFLVRLASPYLAGHARLRHDAGDPTPSQCEAAPNAQSRQLIRWSIQEIRRIATRLARPHVHPAHVIQWSLWRRAHQASAQQAHLKLRKTNTNARKQLQR